MGAWGMAPFENDTYADLAMDVEGAVRPALERKLAQVMTAAHARGADASDKWAAIGVAIVAYHSTYLPAGSVALENAMMEAMVLWKELSTDEEWRKSWRNPRAFKKMFDVVGDELERYADAAALVGKQKQRPLVRMLFDHLESKG